MMQEYLPLNGVVLLLFCAVFNYIAVHLLFSSLFLESSFLIIFVSLQIIFFKGGLLYEACRYV